MIYKYTKCESVIAKIMADLDLAETKLRITDIREWIFEAIEKIGAPMLYIHKETESIPIIENLVPLPDDMHSLCGVAYSNNPEGPWTQTRTTDSTFKNPGFKVSAIGTLIIPRSYHKPIIYDEYKTSINGPIKIELKLSDYEDPTYFIKPGWLVIDRPTGYIKISYNAIATDEKGYPLIPDLASYQEAVFWYVVMKMKFPAYLNGNLGGHRKYTPGIYNDIRQNWAFYRNQAYAEAMMPTEGELRSIKNEWNKLMPDINSDDLFFKDTGSREQIYNDYYYGR